MDLSNTSASLRSEEMQDIIERMPTGWSSKISVVMLCLSAMLIALGFLIEYPETVSGDITIVCSSNPVRLAVTTTGRLHLLHNDGDSIEAGDCIAYIDDGARWEDVVLVDSLLASGQLSRHSFPDSLLLGSISDAYYSMLTAFIQLDEAATTNVYNNMLSRLTEQEQLYRFIVQRQQDDAILGESQLRIYHARMSKDSILYNSGIISEEDMEQKKNMIISQEMQQASRQMSILATQSELNQNTIEQVRVTIDAEEELRKAQRLVAISMKEFQNALRQWKERFVLSSPMNGRVEYLGFWRNGEIVQSGQVVCSVLPFKNGIIAGEAHIPAYGMGKVELGQKTNVKLADYPYNEFGYVRGEVRHISQLTQSIQVEGGTMKAYLVVIDFPDGMVTNHGLYLNIDYEAYGTVEIITRPKRLIQRLFDNLKIANNS